MLKVTKYILLLSMAVSFFPAVLSSSYGMDISVGNASVTITLGTNPVERFSRASVSCYGDGTKGIEVRLPGYKHFSGLSSPCPFLPGWTATADDNNNVTVKSPDGRTYYYPTSSSHMLSAIKDAGGRTLVTFTYKVSDPTLIEKQTDGFDPNLYIEYEYDANGLLITLTARDDSREESRQFNIGYQNNKAVSFSAGSCEACGGLEGFVHEYDANGLLVKVKDANDPNTIIYEYRYDRNNRLTDIYLGPSSEGNHILHLSYTRQGNTDIVDTYSYVDSQNYRVSREYLNSAGMVTRRVSYDRLNEDPGQPSGRSFVEDIVYVYDANKVIVRKVVIPASGYTGGTADPNSGVRREYVYDPNTGKLLIERMYDSNNYCITVSSHTYDYIYDPCGAILNTRMKTYTDNRGSTTYYFYDGNETDPNMKLMPEVVSGVSGTRQLKYQYEYDANRGWMVLERQLDESNNVLVQTRYVYDDYGNLVRRHDDYQGANEEITEYRYNGFNQLIRTKLPSGVVSGKKYNSNGKLESEFVLYDPNDFGRFDDESLKLLSQSVYSYDYAGRLVQVARALDSNETGFRYGQPGQGWIYTAYEYDLRGNRTAVIEDVNGLCLKTSYAYNNQGEVTKVTLANGKWTRTIRDGRGLVSRVEVGYGQEVVATTEYEYDANGNMIWQKNPDGYWTKYEYDDFDRLIRVTRGINRHE